MSDGPASQPAVGGQGDEKARARARVGLTINGKYRIDSLLGVGGMASVYACTHRNGTRKALKILHNEFARDRGITDRFLKEGYVANKVDHRGRVAIDDDGVTEAGEPFLVMELLEGETAQQLWKRKNRKVPVDECLWIAAELCDTLKGFHDQGIVHRDIKPANVFVTRENVVKLLDFGVARMREAGGEATRAGTALGTPSFMAPSRPWASPTASTAARTCSPSAPRSTPCSAASACTRGAPTTRRSSSRRRRRRPRSRASPRTCRWRSSGSSTRPSRGTGGTASRARRPCATSASASSRRWTATAAAGARCRRPPARSSTRRSARRRRRPRPRPCPSSSR